MDKKGLSILGALEELKADIVTMQEKHDDKNKAMFTIEEGELELKLVVRKVGKASGGFKLYLFDSKIDGELSKESVQTLKIKFKAIGNQLTLDPNLGGPTYSGSPNIPATTVGSDGPQMTTFGYTNDDTTDK